MRVVGLDFGTTNSILSFYNESMQSIEAWKMGGSDGQNYIPSYLSIFENDIFIGEEAKTLLKTGDENTYSKFKILLHETNQTKLDEYNYKTKTPKEIAKLYIKTLLDTYKQEQNIDSIDSIVITVPEIWLNDDMQGRSTIKEIADELQLPLQKLISEPVAAGAYFLQKYKNENDKSFNGHLLVFDYGGGTLDITLLEASHEEMRTLERTGKGKDEIQIGKAGVLYDENIVMHLYEKSFDEKLQKNSNAYHELLIDFEKEKISNKKIIETNISRYLKNQKLDLEVFSLRCDKGKISIKPSDMVRIFDDVLKNDVISSLKEIESYFKIYGINPDASHEFRIIMVGGFSNFYLSKSALFDFFGSKTGSDKRFETHFTQEDTTLAISKGAALIANQFVIIDETYPMTIGVVLNKITAYGELEEIKDVVFKKGDKVVMSNTKYNDKNIQNIGKITLYIDNGKTNYKIKIDKNADEIFPDYNTINNKWNIGFSIDSNSFFYLHIKDISGKEIKTEIGNIIEKYKDCLIVENK
jgi:molecular chaperone DnaK